MWWGLVQQTRQYEQRITFRRRIPDNTIRHFLYLHTRCLGIHPKICATQMNTSDNPMLWDSQLSSWLFSELMWQLCPCLNGQFLLFLWLHIRCTCRGFNLAYDACKDFLLALAADFQSPKHALVTNELACFSCDRHHMCVHHCTLNRYHKQFLTDRQTVIHSH